MSNGGGFVLEGGLNCPVWTQSQACGLTSWYFQRGLEVTYFLKTYLLSFTFYQVFVEAG